MARFLVLGATGGTGVPFVRHALAQGHIVRCLARTPSKLPVSPIENPKLEVVQGSFTDVSLDVSALVRDVDYVVSMIGDKTLQQTSSPCTDFFKRLVPAMRENGVKRLLYQAGGFSTPYGGSLGPIVWTLRKTIARAYEGQHRDNEGVMEYLATQGEGIEWMVHRAGINPSSTPDASKGVLTRYSDGSKLSVGTFKDVALCNYEAVMDKEAVGTTFTSHYS